MASNSRNCSWGGIARSLAVTISTVGTVTGSSHPLLSKLLVVASASATIRGSWRRISAAAQRRMLSGLARTARGDAVLQRFERERGIGGPPGASGAGASVVAVTR